jgi:hypothetical protein
VNKREGEAQKHIGATEKMMMTTIMVAAGDEALVVVAALMMKTMAKEAVQEVRGALQAGATMNIIR